MPMLHILLTRQPVLTYTVPPKNPNLPNHDPILSTKLTATTLPPQQFN